MNFIKVVFITLTLLAGQPAFSASSSEGTYNKFVAEMTMYLINSTKERQIDAARMQLDDLRTLAPGTLDSKNTLCNMLARIKDNDLPLSRLGTTEDEIIKFKRQRFMHLRGLIQTRIETARNPEQLDRAVSLIPHLSGHCPEGK